ncbi:MAG TPA: phosphatidate cytidylyltransferase, partial [Actinomycetes bacterium]|nr:phosphatidate cytidylyltransferase [Actinomycetes bacterium]
MAEPAPIDPAGAGAGMPRREPGARAGRNLPLAIVTALLLAGVLIGSLVLSRPAFIAFLLGIVTLALLELLTVLRARATRPAGPVVLAMGALLVAGAYLEGPSALSFGLLVTILAAFGWYLVDRGRTEVTRNVAATIFAVVYVPFMAAHLSLVVGRADHYVGALIGYAALV